MDDNLYFTDEDRVKLGMIAETARGFIHVRPCTRGQFDTWQGMIKSLAPGIGQVPEPPEVPELDTAKSSGGKR